YGLHSLVFLLLPRLNPALFRQITVALPEWLQRAAALVSLVTMGGLVAVQVSQDFSAILKTSFGQRIAGHSLTSVELVLAWGIVGALLYAYARLMGEGKARKEALVTGDVDMERDGS